jgi:hypothetical protein
MLSGPSLTTPGVLGGLHTVTADETAAAFNTGGSAELVPLTDVDLGKAVSGAGAAPLDDKHVALAWVDGDVQAAIVSCGQ